MQCDKEGGEGPAEREARRRKLTSLRRGTEWIERRLRDGSPFPTESDWSTVRDLEELALGLGVQVPVRFRIVEEPVEDPVTVDVTRGRPEVRIQIGPRGHRRQLDQIYLPIAPSPNVRWILRRTDDIPDGDYEGSPSWQELEIEPNEMAAFRARAADALRTVALPRLDEEIASATSGSGPPIGSVRPPPRSDEAGAPRPDGCYSPGEIVYRGAEYRCDLTGAEWDALRVLLPNQERHMKCLFGERGVWRGSYLPTKKTRNKISKLLSRLNDRLVSAEPALRIRFSIRKGTDFITREEFAPERGADG